MKKDVRSIESMKQKNLEFIIASGENLDIYDIVNGVISKSNFFFIPISFNYKD